MKRARTGKIARLPFDVRTELNQRLQDGQSGKEILDWVNQEPFFGANEQLVEAAITEQNLSEWRAGGYEDWLKHEEAKEWVQRLAEQGQELAETADGGIADQFAAYVAVEMTRVAKVLLERETDVEKRWDRLCEVAEKLSRLRRDDHRAEQTRMLRRKAAEAKQREEEVVQEKYEARKKQLREAGIWMPRDLVTTAKIHGGGVEGRRIAARVVEMKYDLDEGCLEGFVGEKGKAEGKKRKAETLNPTESDGIQPNQTFHEQNEDRG